MSFAHPRRRLELSRAQCGEILYAHVAKGRATQPTAEPNLLSRAVIALVDDRNNGPRDSKTKFRVRLKGNSTSTENVNGHFRNGDAHSVI